MRFKLAIPMVRLVTWKVGIPRKETGPKLTQMSHKCFGDFYMMRYIFCTASFFIIFFYTVDIILYLSYATLIFVLFQTRKERRIKMIRPYKMLDGSVIFQGEDVIVRPPSKIEVSKIIHEHFEVSAEETSIPEVDSRVEAIVKEIVNGFPFKKTRLADLAIAVSEAVANAIRHGPQSHDRKVGVNVMYIPKVMLYVCITDDLGKLQIEDINLGISNTYQTDENGRGFFIMTQLTSLVAYLPDDTSKLKEIILGLEPEDVE
jgi:anti-sigma regulatory factor (Ser/Thr protein kinase)